MTTNQRVLSTVTNELARAQDYPSGFRAVTAISLLSLVGAVLTMDVSLFGLLVDPVKHSLGLTDVQIGILQGPASSISYALCAIPAGFLVDRFNRVHLISAGVAIWIAAVLSMAFATSFWMFVLAKIAIGMVMALLLTGPFSLMADFIPPERRARVASVLVIGQYIGAAFGFLTGGLAYDALTRGQLALPRWAGELTAWRVTFVLFVIPCMALLPILAITKEPARKERKEQSPKLLSSLKELGAYKWLLGPLIVAYGFQVIADSTTRTWLSPALMRLYHLTPGQFGGWIGATVLIAGISGSALGGWLAERAERKRSRLTSAVVAAAVVAACSCLALMPTVPLVFALFVVGTVASGAIATISTAVGITYVPNELRGLSSGLLILIAVGPGLAIGPTLVPAVSNLIGGPLALGKAMAIVGVTSGLLAAMFFAFLHATPREEPALP